MAFEELIVRLTDAQTLTCTFELPANHTATIPIGAAVVLANDTLTLDKGCAYPPQSATGRIM